LSLVLVSLMQMATRDEDSSGGESSPAVTDRYRELWPGLVRLARLLTGSHALGEDLAQEAFIGLIRSGDIAAPEAYLRRSVVNASINLGKRRARERAHLLTLREEVSLPPEVDELWAIVEKLPVRQRAVLVLRYQLDLPEAEIARLLQCRPGTVKSLASRALTHLRQEMTS